MAQISKIIVIGLLTLASISQAQRGAIVFEEETVTHSRRVTVLDGGMAVEHGSLEIVRPRIHMSRGTVRIGATVIAADNRPGVVTGMFVAQERIVVQDSFYGNRTFGLNQIGVTSGCVGPFCVGDTAIAPDMRSGRVAGYFGDGRIVIQDSFYGNRSFQMNSVAVAFGCTSALCVEDTVIASDNRPGTIKGFFVDGRVVVNDSFYGNRAFHANNVAMTQAVCSNIFIQRVNFCHSRRY